MGAGTYERKQFAGGAPATSLASSLTDVATSFDVDDATGYPDATYPFVIVIDPGLATEEKCLVNGRTTDTFSSVERGYDDTVAAAHSSGAVVQHVLDASTIDQANRVANLMSAKGQVIASNGTNPVAVAGTAQADDGEDGYALLVKNSESTGLEFARPVHVTDSASAPAVAGVPRVWFDQASGLVRTSDGTDWKIPATCPVFASTGARDTFFGATPVQDGNMCIVGTGTAAVLQVWDGSKWAYMGIPRFTNEAARDAYYTSPVTGDLAYANDTHQLTQYREDEWILINRKVVVSDTNPVDPHLGDLWLQPVS